MLYLEDYLEIIKHLPDELRDRFTEMRELDLSVQNNMDDLEKRVKVLFGEWKRTPNNLPSSADHDFQVIRKEYYKTLDEADEKVALANHMYELVDRYLRRLDTELHKFNCELEADNKGITELLEKRSLELDTPLTTPSSQKENRYDRYNRPRADKRRESCNVQSNYNEKRPHLQQSLSLDARQGAAGGVAITTNGATGSGGHLLNVTGSQQYGNNSINAVQAHVVQQQQHHQQQQQLQQHQQQQHAMSQGAASSAAAASSAGGAGGAYSLSMGAGPAIAAAASQAIAATQQMQQGRRTASLKASYEAINTSSGLKVHDLPIGRELAGAAQTAIQAIQHDTHRKKAKKHSNSGGSNSHSNSNSSGSQHASSSSMHHHYGTTNTAGSTSLGSGTSRTGDHHHHHHGNGGSSGSSSGHHTGMGASASSVVGAMLEMGAVSSGASPQTAATDNGSTIDGVVEGDDGSQGQVVDDADWTYDPNEPRYCLCNQVSYGDMVACDNEDCPSEWFHYPCVGITAPPKGKWYCPQCTSTMRRRGGRKN